MILRLAVFVAAGMLAGCTGIASSHALNSTAFLAQSPALIVHEEVSRWGGNYTLGLGVAGTQDSNRGYLCSTGMYTGWLASELTVGSDATRLNLTLAWHSQLPQGFYLYLREPHGNWTTVRFPSPVIDGQLNFSSWQPSPGSWDIVVCVDGIAAMASLLVTSKVTYVQSRLR